jgi:hypothetical protein
MKAILEKQPGNINLQRNFYPAQIFGDIQDHKRSNKKSMPLLHPDTHLLGPIYPP